MFATLLKCAVFCSGYAAQLSDYFLTAVNMFLRVLVYGVYFFYLVFVHIQNLFHLTDGRLLFCTLALKGWSAENFTVFIYTNITIPRLLFLFRCARSLFFAISITRTQRLFIFIRAHSRYFVTFQSLRLYFFVDVSNCFVDVSIFFVDDRFYKVG